MTTEVRHRLKALRKRAGLRSRDLADAVGMKPSSYQKYEDRRQGIFLPLHIVANLVIALKPCGIDPVEVWALADEKDIIAFRQAWSLTKDAEKLDETAPESDTILETKLRQWG